MIHDVFDILNQIYQQKNSVSWNILEVTHSSAVVTDMGLVAVFLSLNFASLSRSHGRLRKPPGRSTMWRYGHDTPENVNDHETNCGGFGRQWTQNKAL